MKKTYYAILATNNNPVQRVIIQTGLSLSKFEARKKCKIILAYTLRGTAISRPYPTWTGYNHGIYEDYITDKRKDITSRQVINRIIASGCAILTPSYYSRLDIDNVYHQAMDAALIL